MAFGVTHAKTCVFCVLMRVNLILGTLVQTIYNDGKGSVASDVAGGAEGIHRNIEGDDKCLSIGTEAQYASQGA